MALGRYRVPDPLQDEDKWFFLTKRQWGLVLIPLFVIYQIIVFTYKKKLLPLGIFLTDVILEVTGFSLIMEIPPEKYLLGSGNKLEKIVFRFLISKLPFNRKVYVKNLDNDYLRWRDN